MKTHIYCFIVGAAALTGACMGPNPWLTTLEEYGQKWEVTTAGATGYNTAGQLQLILLNGEPVVAARCVTESQAQELLDPNSSIHQLLALDAQVTCEEAADAQNLADDNCDESLSAPYYVGTCLLEGDFCNAGDTGETDGTDTGETDGTGETGGDTGGFSDPTLHVHCEDGMCVIDQSLIDEVLVAGPSAFAADGTTLAPHYTSTGMQDGWEFGGITAGSLGDALQFENGDVVTEVGGVPVDSWTAVIDVANAALHANEVRIRYIRDGRALSRRFVRR